MRPLIAIAILSIILIAGCAGLPDLFGGDVVSVQTKTIENGQRDVIVIKDVQTIPRSPMLPDQSMLLSFVIANKDSLKSAKTSVDLFNAPTVKNNAGQLCNLYTSATVQNSGVVNTNDCPSGETCTLDFGSCGSGSTLPCFNGLGICCNTILPTSQQQTESRRTCIPTNNECGLNGCTVLPGEEKPINFELRTPSEHEIKGIKTDVKLNFKTQYSFSSSLNFILPVVNIQEIIKRQRSGDKTELAITKSYSSGPVQIDAEIQGAPYIISNLEGATALVGNPESIILFNVKDRGSGDVVKSEISRGAMTIRFPPELRVSPVPVAGSTRGSGFAVNDKFSCVETSEGTICVNDMTNSANEDLGRIPLYLGESRSSLRFAVSNRNSLQEPFRSYQITADVNYDYELRNSADITVNPFQNV